MDTQILSELVKHLEQFVTIDAENLKVSGCDGSLQRSISWLKDNVHPSRLPAAIGYLQRNGGHCDCEVILNVAHKAVEGTVS